MTDEDAQAIVVEALYGNGITEEDVVRLVDALTAALRERDAAEQRGRAAERADTIAWLTPRDDEEREAGQAILLRLIDCIEAGRHVGAAGRRET